MNDHPQAHRLLTGTIPGWLQAVIGLAGAVVFFAGILFTVQSDVRHLETRLAADEEQWHERLSVHEGRLRELELASNDRLARIEVELAQIRENTNSINAKLSMERGTQ